MKKLKMFYGVVFLAPMVVTGCASVGSSSHVYNMPYNPEIENERIVQAPFSAVWDRAVGKLASSFYVINNIDKQSRLINLSFSTDTPEEYINCGEVIREFSYGNESNTYEYGVAEDSFYKYAGKWGVYQNLPAVAEVNRTTNLEGRINLYLAPVGTNKTKVATNIRFNFSTTAKGFYSGYNAMGVLAGKSALPVQDPVTISFNTKKPVKKDLGSPGNPQYVTCKSKGTLEAALLDMTN